MVLTLMNVKKAILLLFTMVICSNVFAQITTRPEVIDAKISNFRCTGTAIEFTMKFKAGANYVPNDSMHGRWGALNIYFDIYPEAGVLLNTAAATNDALLPPVYFDLIYATTNHANNPGGAPLGSVSFGITLSRTWDGPNDIQDDYGVVVKYSIPLAPGSAIPTSATYINFRERDDVGGDWVGNVFSSTWSNQRDWNPLAGAIHSETPNYYLESECPPQALWTGVSDSDWFDSDNWTNPVDFTPVGVPCATTDVFIPGTTPRFPMLNGINRVTAHVFCKDVTFFQGGQVGRIDLLTYERARVQLNMYSPFYQSGYNTGFNGAFWNYSYHYSTPPLSNGQWHMLSMPLKGIVSGDLAYGGYPMTVMRKFNVQNSTSGRFTEGTWSTSYTETTEPFAAGEGFAFYVFGGGVRDYSVGFPRDYYSGWTSVPDYTGSYGDSYGLGITNGIIEFPTYDKPDKLQSHRIQKYEGGVSTFYNVFVNGIADWIGKIDYDNTLNTKTRDNSTGNNSDYRFIGDQGLPITNVTYPVPQDWTGGEILVGNPFMSALDFDAFYAVNGHTGSYAMDHSAYRIWNGSEFVTYNCVTRTTSDGSPFTQYIAPMQGFFLTHMGYTLKLDFEAATMSKASLVPVNLRSTSGEEQNIIRLSIRDHQYGTTTNTMIGQLPNASAGYRSTEDVTKLFSSTQAIEKDVNDINFSYIPEIYTSVGDVALSMNYIGREGANVPIGVRVPAAGNSTLKLTGMKRYNADKIELMDKSGQLIADLTAKDSFEYSFSNGEGGYQSGRFILRIAESTTGLDKIETSNNIQIYKSDDAIQVVSSSDDPIKQLRVLDVQGCILYSNTNVDADIYQINNQFEKQQVLVVQAVTEKNTKNVKLIMN